MQTDALNRRFAAEYIKTLTNREVPHDRVYIIFSGVPASGKTTLAKRLAVDLKAQYIQHDAIRELIKRDGFSVSDFTVSHISAIVIDTILQTDKNQLIVIDASLDRTWPRFFEHARAQQAKSIIIRLNVSRKVVEARIEARPEGHVGKVGDLDIFYEQFERSKKEVKATLELAENYDYEIVRHEVAKLVE